jgi:hypothetical protein
VILLAGHVAKAATSKTSKGTTAIAESLGHTGTATDTLETKQCGKNVASSGAEASTGTGTNTSTETTTHVTKSCTSKAAANGPDTSTAESTVSSRGTVPLQRTADARITEALKLIAKR